MASTHPYISGAGNIAQMVVQLRKSFPSTITSETVKKLGLAPNNESFVINALQFIDVIDSEGNKTKAAATVFSHHKDEDFAKQFASLVKKSYPSLFELHGDEAWNLENEDLITFFRQSDQTSAIIGTRQAKTFKIFAALSGHGEFPEPKPKKAAKSIKPTENPKLKPMSNPKAGQKGNATNQNETKGSIGLTVRVEVNLPADGTKETYDNIFKSIKENLLSG